MTDSQPDLDGVQPVEDWVVGHDESTSAGHAVTWALTQADGRRVALAVVRAWQMPATELPFPADSVADFIPTSVCPDFDAVVAAGAAVGVAVTGKVVQGGAAWALLEASSSAELLVVGSRGVGGFRRLLLGSVSSQCATHATVPTVVVPATAPAERPVSRLVVGVDGSDRSLRALQWAIDFAPDGSVVTVVGAWMESRSGYFAVVQEYAHEFERSRQHFHELMESIDTGGRCVLEHRFVHANPAHALLEAAGEADVLVVGERGHGGISAAVLGSVTTHVIHHSEVPVAVVPAED